MSEEEDENTEAESEGEPPAAAAEEADINKELPKEADGAGEGDLE